jgi:hypothetical protein
MLQQRFIHTTGDHLLAAAVDHFLETAHQEQTPLLIQIPFITSEESRLPSGCGDPATLISSFMTSSAVGAKNRYFTARPGRQGQHCLAQG